MHSNSEATLRRERREYPKFATHMTYRHTMSGGVFALAECVNPGVEPQPVNSEHREGELSFVHQECLVV